MGGGLGSAPCPALDPVSQAREYRGGGTLPRHGLEQVCTWGGLGSAPCPALDPVSQAREYRGGGTLPRHGLEQVCTWRGD